MILQLMELFKYLHQILILSFISLNFLTTIKELVIQEMELTFTLSQLDFTLLSHQWIMWMFIIFLLPLVLHHSSMIVSHSHASLVLQDVPLVSVQFTVQVVKQLTILIPIIVAFLHLFLHQLLLRNNFLLIK